MTIEARILAKIAEATNPVFLRGDFAEFGSKSAVDRVIKALVAREVLVRAGWGIYCKTKISTSTGNTIPVATVMDIAIEVMRRLGIKADLGRAAREYNAGLTTQIPVSTVLNVGTSRITRSIGYGKRRLRYERDEIK